MNESIGQNYIIMKQIATKEGYRVKFLFRDLERIQKSYFIVEAGHRKSSNIWPP